MLARTMCMAMTATNTIGILNLLSGFEQNAERSLIRGAICRAYTKRQQPNGQNCFPSLTCAPVPSPELPRRAISQIREEDTTNSLC